jgi:menaquinone-9 beta-reductase
MPRKQTVVIYGGGLAGLSLGIALRKRDVPVELHEAGRYPRHRVCGEFIAGAELSLFEELGIASAFDDALLLETTIWHSGGRPVLFKRLPSPVVSISRYTLDDRLSRIFKERGGVLYCGSRVKKEAVNREGSVWATGRKPITENPSKSAWIGLKCHVSGLTLRSDLEFFIGRKGYLGISPVSKERYNVCGLFQVNRRLQGSKQNLFNQYLEDNGLQHLVPRIEAAVVDSESWCAVTGMDYRKSSGERTRLCIGDQLGLIAPLTGNGMSIAFESAALAVPYIDSWASYKCSWQETLGAIHETQTKTFARRKQVGRLLQVCLLNPFGQSLLRFLSITRLVPFNTLYSLTHQA